MEELIRAQILVDAGVADRGSGRFDECRTEQPWGAHQRDRKQRLDLVHSACFRLRRAYARGALLTPRAMSTESAQTTFRRGRASYRPGSSSGRSILSVSPGCNVCFNSFTSTVARSDHSRHSSNSPLLASNIA